MRRASTLTLALGLAACGGERRPVELVVDERAYGWKASGQLRRIGVQPRVEEAQVVPLRSVSLLEESDVTILKNTSTY